ncbi:cell division protein ZipA [Thalassotalea litorea]|uniref:Cell division protein ZipA n=1 Tax=Thalassotalea litorea TaxID=2020715 RepID=A0A5R9IWG6_9GAMM|nr:cell division protein ZipA [Thalassotalea litorea]TLU67516.1 cell division protein ZipA [Thalassotalea litorea]
MEFNLRDILLIISVLAIAGLCIHGMYTLRKERKNPYKLKKTVVTESTEEKDLRMFDNSGFDQDGVGRPKKVTVNPGEEGNPITDNLSAPSFSAGSTRSESYSSESFSSEPYSRESLAAETVATEGFNTTTHNSGENFDERVIAEEIISVQDQYTNDAALSVASEPAMAEMERIFQAHEQDAPAREMKFTEPTFDSQPEVVEQPEPQIKESTQTKRRVEKTKAQIRRDQMEIDFVDEETPKPASDIEQEVLAISVVAGQHQLISGAALLPSLLTLGMKFGDMNVFHRHQDNSGKGPIHFSLANMVNPGTFDLDNMEHFATTGLTLFMTLPNAGDPSKVFKLMLSAAKQLASEFGGQVLDGQRSVMTRQTEQHYLTKIREFDRKSRIANV